LRRTHYTVVIQTAPRADGTVATAAGNAAKALGLNYLRGRHSGLVVLVVDGRPDPAQLHRAISQQLGSTSSVIGIGSRCETPGEFPRSFSEARRALKIRLRSSTAEGASAFDELGIYRLIDAAHSGGAVEDFVREWLGALMDYDDTNNTDLVATLSNYLEHGGHYDGTANAMHIHRSTLRYRLGRIHELTGHDLDDVNTRFNLHAATRAWQFLNPDS
jgi:DNA-binding PucR family transcriptional regulator